MSKADLTVVAGKITDRLMFISGVNKMATRLIPAIGEEQAGYYNRREVVSMIVSVLEDEFNAA